MLPSNEERFDLKIKQLINRGVRILKMSTDEKVNGPEILDQILDDVVVIANRAKVINNATTTLDRKDRPFIQNRDFRGRTEEIVLEKYKQFGFTNEPEIQFIVRRDKPEGLVFAQRPLPKDEPYVNRDTIIRLRIAVHPNQDN